MSDLSYLKGYPENILLQARKLIDQNKLDQYLLKRYPQCHDIVSNERLYEYSMSLKKCYMKKAPPLNRVCFDPSVSVIHHALGINAHITRAHGGKLKARREIRIDSCFKQCPEDFLRMIVVHELAHLKEREHNKSFYQLCQHMEPEYFQLELDLRLMMTWQQIYQTNLYIKD
ncbi:YgjP-like metallopeptidase domain-containing protein [Oceanospirillum sediminis]|uniref:M48 family metallopeptidase n=1 Tax=Oceanospirillum sediminis TaxID=2760088 RepID=A0A839ILN8_9GAMM|nr:YgjP-like metallopeptidase domain-containing protein [Oceanospirillum sediminis]MBB1485236.1 M48 family metallopeptidase [Oceanospirillum sediminis]